MRSGNAIPYIYASIIAPLPHLIDDLGGTIDRPFRRVGVPVELAAEPDRVLLFDDYLALLEGAARETGDEHFGFSMAERTKISDLGTFGRVIAGAPTLRRAIDACNALVQSYSPAMRCWLESDGDRVYWRNSLPGVSGRPEGGRLDSENTLYLCRTVVRLAAGSAWQPNEVLVGRNTPYQRRTSEARLGAPVRSVDGVWALVFPKELLDLPLGYTKPLDQTEWRDLRSSFVRDAPAHSFVALVKALICGQMIDGSFNVSDVARSLGLTVRTLQRRLAEENAVFSNLVAEVRRDLATKMLADSSWNLLEISMSLGYADAAKFSRAFKQWTGVSPSGYRRALGRLLAAS